MELLTVGELNERDLGVHMATMEEWNEEPGFKWKPAFVSTLGPHTVVVQEDGLNGLHVAVYLTRGEGDLLSLRVYGGDPPQGHDYWATEKADEAYQKAWWDGHDSATGSRSGSGSTRGMLYTSEDLRAARQEAYKHGRKEGVRSASDQIIRIASSVRQGAR